MNSPCRPRDSDCDCNEVRDMPETQLGRPALGVDRCGNDNDYEGVSMTDGGSPAGCRARGLPTFHIVRSSPRERGHQSLAEPGWDRTLPGCIIQGTASLSVFSQFPDPEKWLCTWVCQVQVTPVEIG